jgi:maleate cis-trans isomerase
MMNYSLDVIENVNEVIQILKKIKLVIVYSPYNTKENNKSIEYLNNQTMQFITKMTVLNIRTPNNLYLS